MLEPAFALLGPVALMSVALCWIDRHFRRFDGYRNPSLLGLMVEISERDFAGPTIGWWGDHRLHEFVFIRNRYFEYDRLVPRDYCYRVAADKLFIAPGVVYLGR